MLITLSNKTVIENFEFKIDKFSYKIYYLSLYFDIKQYINAILLSIIFCNIHVNYIINILTKKHNFSCIARFKIAY